jgi:gliding motility-associated-like protein
MKRVGLSLALIFSTTLWAQNIQWAHHISSFQIDVVESFAVDPDENVVAVGYFGGTISINGVSLTSRGQSDIVIYKTTKYGEVIWAHTFGGPMYQGDVGVDLDSDGNIYVAGGFVQELYFDDSKKMDGNDSWNSFLAKLNPQGELTWVKELKSTGIQDVRVFGALDVNPAGDVIVAMHIYGDVVVAGTILTSVDPLSLIAIKFDKQGNILWRKNAPTTSSARVTAVKFDQGNHVYITGHFTGEIEFDTYSLTAANTSNSDIFLAKYDADGAVLWADGLIKTTTDELNNEGRGLKIDATSGDVFITGIFKGTIRSGLHQITGINTAEDPASADGFIARYASTGDLLWLERVGTDSHDILNDIAITNRSTVLVCGGRNASFIVFFQEFDFNGNVLSERDFNVSGIAEQIQVTDGDIYLAGHMFSDFVEDGINLTSKGWDGFLIRIGLGDLPVQSAIPNVYTPNGDTFNESFQLPIAYSGCILTVYNRWGQLVFEDSHYQNTWTGKDLNSGIYYYKITRSCCGSIKGWVQIVR